MKKGRTTGILPRGRVSITYLGEGYIIKLDRLARKWGCETLGEAMLELIKDAIDQEIEK